MPINYSSSNSGNWLRLPKTGQSYDFSGHGKIIKAEKVTTGRFHFERDIIMEHEGKKVKAKENLGYHYEFTVEDGKILSVSSWKPYYAFRDANVQEGCLIKVNHPKEGEWSVEILGDESLQEETPF